MREQVAWMVGGQQGEGIESTGAILAGAFNRFGYFLHGYRTFSSRIKGGHTNYKLTVAPRRILASQDDLDILVAFDQETIKRNARQVRPGGVIVADSSDFRAELPADLDVRLLEVPLTRMAEDLGARVVRNMVAVGVTAALIGLEPEAFHGLIDDRFARKGDKVVAVNRDAVAQGYRFASEGLGRLEEFHLAPGVSKPGYLMSGDEAVAFGALVAGCRLVAAYPITPASEVMEYLARKLPEFGGVVVQCEDEIASIMMAVGAGYAGVRALTATSGPGFSLMMEGLGYAGVIEAPVVIVDAQRAGPSTGMPTKHEQSDLFEMVYGSHGDLIRVVLAPTTVEECFWHTVEAFNLADRYQCPVVVGLDFTLATCIQTVPALDLSRVTIDRGVLADEAELMKRESRRFDRYALTDSGISPRSLPGMRNGLHLATGLEHSPTGQITEDPVNRSRMMNKRARKILDIPLDGAGVLVEGPDQADLVLVGWGSTIGPIAEARRMLEKEGLSVRTLMVRYLMPFPRRQVEAALANAGQVVVVENNHLGQLATHLKAQGVTVPTKSVTKYDGIPFHPRELVGRIKEVL